MKAEREKQEGVPSEALPLRPLRAGSSDRQRKPAKEPKKFIAAYVPDETHAALQSIAEAGHRTLSGLVRQLIQDEPAAQTPLLAKRRN